MRIPYVSHNIKFMLSKSVKDTSRIAKIFLGQLLRTKKKKRRGALVVGLSGDLGAGKTAFTKFAARCLRIQERVCSPTYVIMKKYPISHLKYKFFFHFDAYRLKDEKELVPLKWQEIIQEESYIVFVEWPEKIAKAMPRGARTIKIEDRKDGGKSFVLE